MPTSKLTIDDSSGMLALAAEEGDLEAVNLCIEGIKSNKGEDELQRILDDSVEYDETPLLLAVKGGHTGVVKALINAGAGVEDMHSTVTLRQAVLSGHGEVIKSWIEGVKVKGNFKDIVSQSGLLRVAAKSGHVEVVEALINAGAEVNMKDISGNSPLSLALDGGHSSVVYALLKGGASVEGIDLRQQNSAKTALLLAEEGGEESVVKALSKAGVLVDSHETPLLLAAKEGLVEAVEELIKAGAEVNVENIYGISPLSSALDGGHSSVVYALLKAGASVEGVDLSQEKSAKTALLLAEEGGEESVVEALSKAGVQVTINRSSDETPLLLAAKEGLVEAVEALIKAGAEVNVENIYGISPLSLALDGGHSSVVYALLKGGASVEGIDLSKENSARAALFSAAEDGEKDVVGVLIDANVGVGIYKNSTGETPLLLAAKGGHVEVVRKLINARAKVSDLFLEKQLKAVVAGCSVRGEKVVNAFETFIQAGVEGGSLLTLAVESGYLNVVNSCIEGLESCKEEDELKRILDDSGVLKLAVERNYSSVVYALLKAGANVHGLKVKKKTSIDALFSAAKAGNIDVVRALVDEGVLVNMINPNGESPLLLAAQGGSVEVVKKLMEAGARVDSLFYGAQLKALQGGCATVVNTLIQAGSEADALLTMAVKSEDLNVVNSCIEGIKSNKGEDELQRILDDSDAHNDAHNLAEEAGHQEVVEALRYAGAGWTPLRLAAQQGHHEAVKALLEEGADVTYKEFLAAGYKRSSNKEGVDDVFMRLFKKAKDDNKVDDIKTEVRNASPEIKKQLGVKKGGELGVKKGGEVLIAELIELTSNRMNKKGSSSSLASKEGSRSSLASKTEAMKKDREMIEEYKRSPAGVTQEVRDQLVHLAVKYFDKSLLEQLINAGANVNNPDADGRTPLNAAAKKGYPGVVKVLIAAGAKVTYKAFLAAGYKRSSNKEEEGGDDVFMQLFRKAKEDDKVEEMIQEVGSATSKIKDQLKLKKGDEKRIADLIELTSNRMNKEPQKGNSSRLASKIEAMKKDREMIEEYKRSPAGVTQEVRDQLVHLAVKYFDKSLLEQLINAGADVNKPDADGRTPLNAAAKSGNPGVVNALINAKAEVKPEDVELVTAMLKAYDGSREGSPTSAGENLKEILNLLEPEGKFNRECRARDELLPLPVPGEPGEAATNALANAGAVYVGGSAPLQTNTANTQPVALLPGGAVVNSNKTEGLEAAARNAKFEQKDAANSNKNQDTQYPVIYIEVVSDGSSAPRP